MTGRTAVQEQNKSHISKLVKVQRNQVLRWRGQTETYRSQCQALLRLPLQLGQIGHFEVLDGRRSPCLLHTVRFQLHISKQTEEFM